MVGIELEGFPLEARIGHRVTLEARRPRRHHPPAGRHRRAHAPALDPAGGAAPAGGDHRVSDRRRGGRPRPRRGRLRHGGRRQRGQRGAPRGQARAEGHPGAPIDSKRAPAVGDLDEAHGHRVETPASAPLAHAAGRAHARHRDDRASVDVDGLAVAEARTAGGRQQLARCERSIGTGRLRAEGLGHRSMLVLVRSEVALSGAAHGTEPGVGDVVEGRARRDAPVGVSVGGVVDEAAGIADPLLRGCRLAHGPKGTFHTVEIDRPPPGEELNLTGEETVPRQAATVILLRGGSDALEVLLVKRTPHARFMGGVWVFPGGAVDAGEGEGDAAHRVAAVRELEEEAGIVVADPGALVKFSRWITPAEVVVRFDTHFFLAALPDGQEATIDGDEIVDEGWFTPADALAAHRDGEIELVFPTIKHLEQLAGFASADALLEFARGREVGPVQPRVVTEGETTRLLLPGEPGYDD